MMKKLLEEYDAVEQELDNSLMSELVNAFNENMSYEERKKCSEGNRKIRIAMQFELLYLLICLNEYDCETYQEKMLDALKTAIGNAEFDAYYYESEQERVQFTVSMLSVFLGDKWENIYPFLPDKYKDVPFTCDGYTLGKVIYALEGFDLKNFHSKSSRVIYSFLHIVENPYNDIEADVFFSIIDILLREYLIDAMPDILTISTLILETNCLLLRMIL